MTEGVNAEPLETKVARHQPVIEAVQPNPRFGTIARPRSTQPRSSQAVGFSYSRRVTRLHLVAGHPEVAFYNPFVAQ